MVLSPECKDTHGQHVYTNARLASARWAAPQDDRPHRACVRHRLWRALYCPGAPYLAIANRQAEIMMRIASEFGFTRASRSRISTPVSAEPTLFDGLDAADGK
jgi:hypothetical protein